MEDPNPSNNQPTYVKHVFFFARVACLFNNSLCSANERVRQVTSRASAQWEDLLLRDPMAGWQPVERNPRRLIAEDNEGTRGGGGTSGPAGVPQRVVEAVPRHHPPKVATFRRLWP